MPYKKPKIEKVVFTVGEVAKMLGVGTPTIRHWENEFDALKPQRNNKGNRLFSKEDLELVKLINHLVKERGLTIKGAKQKLKDNRNETIDNYEIIDRLQAIKNELLAISDSMVDE